MDEVEYKLGSNNTILITHGISKILETIKNKITSGEDTSKITELQSLFLRCKSTNDLVSSVACQGLVSLVERGHLAIAPTLSKLIAILGETKNYLAVTSATCNLLMLEIKQKKSTDKYTCQFAINAPQHPLITILTQNNDAWRNILGQMQSILYHSKPEFIDHNVELLRPVFMYILCNPGLNLPENCRQQTWHLLIRTHKTLNIQLEIVQWLRTNDLASCINANNLILELAEFSIAKKSRDLCTSLAPLITALAFDLLKYNHDPRSNILILENILEHCDDTVGGIIISLLSEMLLITPVIYLHDIIRIGTQILPRLSCSRIITQSLVAAILPWMAYATPLSSEALDLATELISSATTKQTSAKNPENIFSSPIFNVICHANESVQFYANISNCIAEFDDENTLKWLQKIAEIPAEFTPNYRNILSGIVLASNNSLVTSKAAELLLRIVKNNPKSAGFVLSLVLYKLSEISAVEETKTLLEILPELAISKENVPIIVHTLQTLLNSGEPLNYLAINLYLKAWIAEPRCHRHLLSALIDMSKNDKTMMGRVTCAKAMKFICETNPQHGTELVPFLSQTLNQCTDMTGGAASALALRGISALCVAGIADVCSTWRVLAPKMNKEERPIVIRSMCEFFGDIPPNPGHPEEEYARFLDQVLTKLWQFACSDTWISRNSDIVQSAFTALSVYTINQMNLGVLPDSFKADLELPPKFAAEIDKKPEEVLDYIPGTCWITMLEVIHEPSRKMAGDLLIKFISDELYGFKTGIYTWTISEPINYKYLPEKSPVRAVGEYLRRYNSICHPDKPKIVLECLRIFSHKYLKALPPIKFGLLIPAMKMSDVAWDYGLSLACHQATVSPSAKEFISKYMTELANEANNSAVSVSSAGFKKCWHLVTNLGDICHGVMSNILGPFLDAVMNVIEDKALINNDTAADLFNQLMEHFSGVLKDDLVHYDNKTLITDILERLLDKIDIDSKVFPNFVSTMLDMSIDQIERLSLPSVWTEITDEKLTKAIFIRAGLVLKENNEIPLSWMNEIIRVSSSYPGVRKCLLSNLQKVQSQLRTEKSNASWTIDLMYKIQTTIVNSNDNNSSLNAVTMLCDILFITIITLACDNCLVANDDIIITSHDVRAQLFPHALATITERSYWKDVTQQFMEWLHAMRTSLLPDTYKMVFHNALVSLKKSKHLNDSWKNYFSTKISISL